MPRSRTIWHCDFCPREYKTESQAAECEQKHFKVIGIEDVGYDWDGRYPEYIIVNIDVGGKVEQVAYRTTKRGE